MSLKVPETATQMIQKWSPRPLNRGEYFELDHYEIFYAKQNARVKLHLQVKDKKIVVRTFDGVADFVYSEVLKAIPDNRLEDFKADWINTKLDFIYGDNLTTLGQAIARKSRDKLKIPTKNKKADFVEAPHVNIKFDIGLASDPIQENNLAIIENQ